MAETPLGVGSPFEALSRAVFSTTVNVMGYAATWVPTTGGPALTATVHFKNPTEVTQVLGFDYAPEAWQMEYFEDDLPGLKNLADLRASTEIVTIGEHDWYVVAVDKKHDGRTYLATLKPVPA